MIEKLAANSGINATNGISLDRIGIASPVRSDLSVSNASFEQAMAELAVESAQKVPSKLGKKAKKTEKGKDAIANAAAATETGASA